MFESLIILFLSYSVSLNAAVIDDEGKTQRSVDNWSCSGTDNAGGDVENEERGHLGSQEICILEVSCKNSLFNFQGHKFVTAFKAYCRPNSSDGRCPTNDAQSCANDRSIKAGDIPKIRYYPPAPQPPSCQQGNSMDRPSVHDQEKVRGGVR